MKIQFFFLVFVSLTGLSSHAIQFNRFDRADPNLHLADVGESEVLRESDALPQGRPSALRTVASCAKESRDGSAFSDQGSANSQDAPDDDTATTQ